MTMFGDTTSITEGYKAEEESQARRRPIEEGEYVVALSKLEIKDAMNKNQTKYKQFHTEFEVVEGDRKGKKIYMMFMLEGEDTAMHDRHVRDLGILSAIVQAAVGAPVPNLEQIYGKPFYSEIIIAPGRNGYPARNELKPFSYRTYSPASIQELQNTQLNPALNQSMQATGTVLPQENTGAVSNHQHEPAPWAK